MKKFMLFLGVVIFSFFMVDTVYAGNLNEHEQAIIEAAGEVYEYNGKSYRADQIYIDQLVTYLKQDNIDITAGDKDLIIQIAYANIELGIKDGYLKPIEDLKSQGGQREASTKANTEETVKEILESVGKDISDIETYLPSLGGGINNSDTENITDNSDAINKDNEENTSNNIEINNSLDTTDSINSLNSSINNSNLATTDNIINKSTSAGADDIINSSSSDVRDNSPDDNTERNLDNSSDNNPDNNQDISPDNPDNNQSNNPDNNQGNNLDSSPYSSSDAYMISDDNYSYDEGISKQLADNLRTTQYIMIGLGILVIIGILIVTGIKYNNTRLSSAKYNNTKHRSEKHSSTKYSSTKHIRNDNMSLENNYIDIHSHILPGVDDGPDTMDQTIEMLKIAERERIIGIIATPHYEPGGHNPSVENLKEVMNKVQQEAYKINKDLKLYLGNEIGYSESVVDLLKSGEALTLAGSRYVLIEFLYGTPFTSIYRGINKLIYHGYIPILAHVERYYSIHRKPDMIEELINMGCYIQMNCDSFMGGFMNTEASFNRKLIKKGLVHFVGSDCHNDRVRVPIMQTAVNHKFQKSDDETVRRIFIENPTKILENIYI